MGKRDKALRGGGGSLGQHYVGVGDIWASVT